MPWAVARHGESDLSVTRTLKTEGKRKCPTNPVACREFDFVTIYPDVIPMISPRRLFVYFIVLASSMVLLSSCFLQRPIYETIWIAEEYFDDPNEVALCKAIEKQDIGVIDKLIAGGVDINAKGKDGMSFLLWSFPAGEKVFERILHHGADPNYVCESKYDTPGYLKKGRTILERAIMSYHDRKFENYIDLLLQYGADPDFGEIPPLFTALDRSKNFEMVKKLVDAGADMNISTGTVKNYSCPVCSAAVGNRYQSLQLLLDSGAEHDPTTKPGGALQRALYLRKKEMYSLSDQYKEDLLKVMQWLEKRGVTFDEPVPPEKSNIEAQPFRKFPKKKERQEETQADQAAT